MSDIRDGTDLIKCIMLMRTAHLHVIIRMSCALGSKGACGQSVRNRIVRFETLVDPHVDDEGD
jgi:hypothetical protein